MFLLVGETGGKQPQESFKAAFHRNQLGTEVGNILGEAGHTGLLVLIVDLLRQLKVEEEIRHVLDGRLVRVELLPLVDQDSLVSRLPCLHKLGLPLAEVEEPFEDDLR